MYTLSILSLAARGLSLAVSVNSGPSPRVRIEAKPHKCQIVTCPQFLRLSFLRWHVARTSVVGQPVLEVSKEVMVEVILLDVYQPQKKAKARN